MAKPKLKVISNEILVSALLTSGSITAAAKKLGISTRAVYDRMLDKDFQAMYQTSKTDILMTASNKVNNLLSKAVDTLAEVMDNKENNDAVRMQAAQAIISNSVKLNSRMDPAEANEKDIETIVAEAEERIRKEVDSRIEKEVAAFMDMAVHILTAKQRIQLAEEAFKLTHKEEQPDQESA